MKKYISMLFACCFAFIMTSCAYKTENAIGYGYSDSINGSNDSNPNECGYSYKVSVTPENKDISGITNVDIIYGNSVNNKVINTVQPITSKDKNTFWVEGEIIVDTTGLSEKEIVELRPFIDKINVTLSDGSVHTVPFD